MNYKKINFLSYGLMYFLVILFTTHSIISCAQYPSNRGNKARRVIIKNYAFRPSTITVKAGRKVTWVNYDKVDHTVTSVDNTMASTPHIVPGGHASYVFKTPGTYGYYCSIHPKMHGKVIVD